MIARGRVHLSRGERGERPGALLARRTRTIRMCSFDAGSGRPNRPPSCERRCERGRSLVETVLAWEKSVSRRARGWAGDKVARSEGRSGSCP